MKGSRPFIAALGVGGLVAMLPEWLGPGPRADFDVGARLAAGAVAGPLVLVFAGGLLTALTPCVYPLIPITVSVFGAKKTASRARATGLTLVYILGIATMFTALGIAAALTGRAFGTVLGSPWVVGGLALLLVVFAFSMFGAFDFQLPAALQTRVSGIGKAGIAGAFAMGLAAGVVAAPCTGPVLSAVLVHVATTQNVPLGASLLFTYALGLGVPFFLIGALSVSLPKSGAWMEAVKSVFGIALLALAALYLRDAFPRLKTAVSLKAVEHGAMIAAALVGGGVLVGAVHRSFRSWPAEGLLKGTGVLLAVVGLMLRPGAPIARPMPAPAVRWMSDEPAALALARAQGKALLIDFSAEWCAACKELDRYVYPHESFAEEARRFVLVRIDDRLPDFEKLQQRYKVTGLPTVLFVDSQGARRDDLTLTGFVGVTDFVDVMKKVH